MKYKIGSLVYLNIELQKFGFFAKTAKIIYYDPRYRRYTVRFSKGKVAYCSDSEITPVSAAHAHRRKYASRSDVETFRSKADELHCVNHPRQTTSVTLLTVPVCSIENFIV